MRIQPIKIDARRHEAEKFVQEMALCGKTTQTDGIAKQFSNISSVSEAS